LPSVGPLYLPTLEVFVRLSSVMRSLLVLLVVAVAVSGCKKKSPTENTNPDQSVSE